MNPTSRAAAAVVLTLAALASSALPAPSASAQDGPGIPYALHVTVRGEGSALAGAHVHVQGDERAVNGTTGPDGSVVFTSLPEGETLRVTASAPGYASATETVPFPSEVATVEFDLEPSGATADLVVLVVDAVSREPIPDAFVLVGSEEAADKRNGRTGADGRVTFEDFPLGRLFAEATADGYATRAGEATFTGAGHTIALRSAEADATVTVVVTGPDGDPIEGARVSGTSWETHASDAAATDAEGVAVLRLGAGRGGVNVEADDHYGQWREFDASDGDARVEVRLEKKPERDATLAGRVVDEDGEPVAGATLVVWSEPRHDRREVAIAEGEERVMAPYACCPDPVEVVTDDDGRFEARVVAGHLRVEVRAKGYASQTEQVTVEPGATARLDVEVAEVPPKDAVVSGRVVDATTGLPVANANVQLQNLAWSDWGWATTDRDGRYSVTTYPGYVQLRVHTYHGPVCVAATDVGSAEPAPASDVEGNASGASAGSEGRTAQADVALWPSPCADPDEPQVQYYAYVAQLDLASGDNRHDARLDPKPRPSVALVGYVVDPASGTGVPGAWVSVHNQDTGEWGNAQADEHGSYRILVRPGRFLVDAHAEGYHPKSETVLVREDAVQRHDVELRKGTTRWAPHHGDDVVHTREASSGAPVAMDGAKDEATYETALAGGDADARAETAGTATGGARAYEGGGGGLGPYRPQAAAVGDHEAPGAAVAALVGLAGALALLRRRA